MKITAGVARIWCGKANSDSGKLKVIIAFIDERINKAAHAGQSSISCRRESCKVDFFLKMVQPHYEDLGFNVSLKNDIVGIGFSFTIDWNNRT